jgi:hypothetical protein
MFIMKKRHSYKVIAGAITVGILIILIMSGPAQAFILGLVIDDNEVEKGEVIDFIGSIEIEANEQLEINYLVLRLNGPEDIECRFNINGSIISGCKGIMIDQISTTPDYGYGFEQGILSYNFSLDTAYYFSGIYETLIGMVFDGETMLQRGEEITIKANIDTLSGCSIRSEGEVLISENQEFGEGKINFHLPLGHANNGKGSLLGQRGRSKFSYKYNIVEILENNENYARILVSGKYKIDRGDEKIENSIIYFDKINNKISLNGDSINLEDTDITFRKMC